MGIMSYSTWMSRTKRGVTKPRSTELRQLDAALKAYTERQSGWTLDALYAAASAWSQCKSDTAASTRNRDGAVDELFAQIDDEFEKKNNLANAKHDIGRMNRPAGFLDEVRGGAAKLKSGQLTGMVPKTAVPVLAIVKDNSRGNVVYENFVGTDLAKAKRGWADAYLASARVVAGMQAVRTNPREKARFETWFGPSTTPGVLDRLIRQAGEMRLCFQTREITLVNRTDIQVHLVDGDDPLAPMTDSWAGHQIYGYVWSAGNHTGGGIRVIMSNHFLQDPDPLEGAAQTVYHELSHKVLGTKDHIYGIAESKALDQGDKITNADNWAWYAISFFKAL